MKATFSYEGYTSDPEEFEVTIAYQNSSNSFDSYYASINATTSAALKQQLRTLITNTHKITTSYDDCKEHLQEADEDPNNSNNMILFYTGTSVTKSANMSVWNREHVWAQSLTNNWFGTSGAGADLHHIRPCNPSVNGGRGNKKFGESSGYFNPANFTISDVTYTSYDCRGDVARILFYMFTRYPQADSRSVTDIAESWDILLKWNEEDPVSEIERIRNDYIDKDNVQGNRNPFIDHPEWANTIWG